MNRYVVTVATGGTPDLFGPFDSRAKAWEFAHQIRRRRRHDALMPAVDVQTLRPSRAVAAWL